MGGVWRGYVYQYISLTQVQRQALNFIPLQRHLHVLYPTQKHPQLTNPFTSSPHHPSNPSNLPPHPLQPPRPPLPHLKTPIQISSRDISSNPGSRNQICPEQKKRRRKQISPSYQNGAKRKQSGRLCYRRGKMRWCWRRGGGLRRRRGRGRGWGNSWVLD